MSEYAVYTGQTPDAISVETLTTGLRIQLSAPGGAGFRLNGGTVSLSGFGEDGCFLLSGEGLRRIRGTETLGVRPGDALLLTGASVTSLLGETEILVDRLKSAGAAQWLDHLLLRLVPRTLMRTDLILAAVIF